MHDQIEIEQFQRDDGCYNGETRIFIDASRILVFSFPANVHAHEFRAKMFKVKGCAWLDAHQSPERSHSQRISRRKYRAQSSPGSNWHKLKKVYMSILEIDPAHANAKKYLPVVRENMRK